MFVLKRNQVIITALVVMIAVAGYLNYVDSKPGAKNPIALNDQGEISALVMDQNLYGVTNYSPVKMVANAEEIGSAITIDDNPSISTSSDVKRTAEPGEAIFVNNSLDSSYFLQAKLDREQARAKEREILTEMINNPNIEQGKKAAFADAMLDIQGRIEKETGAEALIEAKGFKEAYVRIDEGTVDVVVSKEEISIAQIAQIEDIVRRKTGVTSDKIHISPMRK